jgi:predicted RNA-binding protein YlxR (DUF448 family)
MEIPGVGGTSTRAGRTRHVPERRCLGCGRSAPKAELARFAAIRDGERAVLVHDDRARMGGRGLYVCRRPDCFERAAKRRAFARAARLRGVALEIDPALERELGGQD